MEKAAVLPCEVGGEALEDEIGAWHLVPVGHDEYARTALRHGWHLPAEEGDVYCYY